MRRALSPLMCLLAACGSPASYPEVPKPPPPAAPAATTVPAPGDDPEPPPGPPLEPFELAWARQVQPFVRGLAVSAEQVAVLSNGRLELLSLRSGAPIAERASCARFGSAFGFVAPDRGALLCDDGVHVLRLPALEEDAIVPADHPPRVASFAAGRAAIAFAGGGVRVLATDGWQQLRAVDVAGEVTALDLSPDGSAVAVGLAQGEVWIQRLDGDTEAAPTRVTVRAGLPIEALACTPRCASFFAAAGPLAATFGADGELHRRVSMLAGVTAARWLSPRQVGTAGREGLLMADALSGAVGGIGGGLLGDLRPVALVVDDAHGALCAASTDGLVACLSRGDLPSSPQLPLQVGVPMGIEEIAAQVTFHQGKTLSVAPLPGMPFAPEEGEVTLLRFSRARVAGARSLRWIEAADCHVAKVGADEIELSIVSRPEGAAVPLEPFSAGDPVKLRWPKDGP